MLMHPLPTPNTISRALFETDPMHTCCAENACFDEYGRVAAGAVSYMENGYTLAQALHKALQDWFGIELTAGRDLSHVLALVEIPTDHRAAEIVDQYHNEIGAHWCKEYLLTFSETGTIKVRVKFEQSDPWIAERRMQPQEISSLIDPTTGDFLTVMTFDGNPFELTRIDLSLTRKTLTIHARPPTENSTVG